MKRLQYLINKKIRRVTRKISDFFRGLFALTGTAFGVKRTEFGYDCNQLYTAGVILVFVIPLGILFLQSSFSLAVTISIIASALMLVNLDRVMLLTSLFAEDGVEATLSKNYEQLISEMLNGMPQENT